MCCKAGLTCFRNSCVINNIGATCDIPIDCVGPSPGGDVKCFNKHCYGIFQEGDKCGTDIHSLCVDNTTCTAGYCVGNKLGQSCIPAVGYTTCNYGLYCAINGTCIARTPFNGNTTDSNSCMEGSVNHGGVCIKLYSVPIGGSCENEDQLCVVGATCTKNNNSAFVCTAEKDVACHQLESNVITCFLANKCMIKEDTYVYQNFVNLYSMKGSCAVVRCNDPLEKYIDCNCKLNVEKKTDSCLYFGGRSCNDDKPFLIDPFVLVLIIVGVLALVLGVAIVVVLYLRRRQNYSPINQKR